MSSLDSALARNFGFARATWPRVVCRHPMRLLGRFDNGWKWLFGKPRALGSAACGHQGDVMKSWCRRASVWMALLFVLALLGCSAEGTERELGTDALKGELVVYI